MTLDQEITNNNRGKNAMWELLNNVKQNQGRNIVDVRMGTHAHRDVKGSREYVDSIANSLRELNIYKQGLCEFELVVNKPGSEPLSGKNDDRYKHWFYYIWKLTPFGEQVYQRVEIGLKFGILFDFTTFELDMTGTAAKAEAYLERDALNNGVLTKLLENNDYPEFDKAKKQFILEKLARTNKSGVLVR